MADDFWSFEDDHGRKHVSRVTLGRPVPLPQDANGDWYCPVVIGHAVIVTIRRRGSDLAVLRTMGLGRRGVYQAISTHTALLAIVGTIVGIPLGIVAGQAMWRGLASSLGVVVSVEVPWPAIAAVAVTACLALAALSLLPARAAAHARVASMLRAE